MTHSFPTRRSSDLVAQQLQPLFGGVGDAAVIGGGQIGIGARLGPPDAARATLQLKGSSKLEPFSRSEEHTSELQSLMRNSYAVFCLKKKKQTQYTQLDRQQMDRTHRREKQ